MKDLGIFSGDASVVSAHIYNSFGSDNQAAAIAQEAFDEAVQCYSTRYMLTEDQDAESVTIHFSFV
ncbi:hypothetical protein [Thiothrix sp.]|uniref:hypothetical protein n=1 Tax=Thiothrix sp. TaxID=1032 RepID=UPI00257B03E2|nr:hypothetical protein [Thiothrix sp.]